MLLIFITKKIKYILQTISGRNLKEKNQLIFY